MRYEDWPERLNTFIESRRNAAFVFGETDCCMFAADAVLTITGVDLAADLRGTYSTKLGAAKVLSERGGVAGVVTLPAIPVLMAGRGDVVMIETPDGPALAVCIGSKIAAMSADGLAFVGMDTAITAWKVD